MTNENAAVAAGEAPESPWGPLGDAGRDRRAQAAVRALEDWKEHHQWVDLLDVVRECGYARMLEPDFIASVQRLVESGRSTAERRGAGENALVRAVMWGDKESDETDPEAPWT